jgi:hypothetical protein
MKCCAAGGSKSAKKATVKAKRTALAKTVVAKAARK